MSKILFIVLWILTVLLVLFSVVSFAGVVVRIPALISLCIATLLSVLRKRSRSWVWITGCVLGILVSLSAIYPLATAHGSLATSSDSLGSGNKILTSQEPPVKPSEVANILAKSEDQLRATSGIVITASAFDGKRNIKLRLMVHGVPSKKEATNLFDDILTVVKENAHNKDVWSYYNGQFDIKNYTTGVVYTATKNAGQPIVIDKTVQKND